MQKRAIFLMMAAAAITVAANGRDRQCEGMITAADMPERWQYTAQMDLTLPTDDDWWRSFGDPVLDSLIAVGMENNYNVAQAARRIEIARQGYRQAQSAYWPQLSVSAGWNRQRSSGVMTPVAGDASVSSYFNIGATMSWEIDVFGRITDGVKAKKSAWQASRAEYAGAMVSVAANIASGYFQLRTLQGQKAVLEEHIASQAHVDSMTVARFNAGLASKLDVAQARTNLLSTRASMMSIETSITTTENALAVLLGVFPEDVAPMLEAPASMPDFRQMVPAGVPMELLRRRPDVVAAEYELAGYASAVGVAKKDFLPVLSLQGSIGTAAHDGGKLFTGRSFTYSVAPTLQWTVFDGMARKASLVSAKQQLQAGIDNYNLTVLTAVQEVDNAMATYINDLQYIDLITETVEQARESYDLSITLYKNDLASFINVSNAQITLLQYSSELVAARGQALAALVQLYQALGGGFTPPKS